MWPARCSTPSRCAGGTRAMCLRRTSCSPRGGRPMGDGVSVVIPSRDRAHIVVDTVRLTLGQRGVEFEVIVVDDGSRDGTAEALEALDDPRVVVLRNAINRGVAHARNRGIEQAAHPWIAFLDDDDRWSPDKLRAQLDGAVAEAADFVYTAGLAVSAADGQVLYM